MPGAHLGIAVNLHPAEALLLNGAGMAYPPLYVGRRFCYRIPGEFLKLKRRHFHMDVDAVKQGPGNFRAVALDQGRGAGAFMLGIGEIAARAPMRFWTNTPSTVV